MNVLEHCHDATANFCHPEVWFLCLIASWSWQGTCWWCSFVSVSYPWLISSYHGVQKLRISAGSVQQVLCNLKMDFFFLFCWQHFRHKFHSHSAQVQISMQNLLCGIFMIPTSSAISHAVKRRSPFIRLFILTTTAMFSVVFGLPECWSLSSDAWPFLNRLNHTLICVAPIVSFPNTCWILWIVLFLELTSLLQNLMQFLCSFHSVIVREIKKIPTYTYNSTSSSTQKAATGTCKCGEMI